VPHIIDIILKKLAVYLNDLIMRGLGTSCICVDLEAALEKYWIVRCDKNNIV
jgi:hypothetical protein